MNDDEMPTRQVTIGQLAQAVPGAHLIGDAATPIVGITYDSRQVRPGYLFAALVGGDFDGHDFIQQAVANGASAVLVERQQAITVPQIVASGSSRSALAPISCELFGHPSRELTVIGITGTDGKTTTSAMLEGILRTAGLQVGAIGTVGVRIGNGARHDIGHQTTPESNHVQRFLREMVDAGTTHVVIEATSHGLVTHRLDGVEFDVGGVTNITHEHLEFHKTIENYRRAKATLLERVGQHAGIVVLNTDDEGASSIRPFAAGAEVQTYSTSGKSATFNAKSIVRNGTGQSSTVAHDNMEFTLNLPMPGAFNVANALCALGLALACNVDLKTALQSLETSQAVKGRMQPVQAGQPFDVVVDYAHTPESIRTVLTLLKPESSQGRLIVVTGSAGERDTAKRPLQGAACAEIADMTIVTSEDPRHESPEAIIEEIVAGAVTAGARREESVFAVTDRRDAIRMAFTLARSGDCVLLAGKGHEASIIWGAEHRPWDEVAVAEGVLQEMFGPPR